MFKGSNNDIKAQRYLTPAMTWQSGLQKMPCSRQGRCISLRNLVFSLEIQELIDSRRKLTGRALFFVGAVPLLLAALNSSFALLPFFSLVKK